MTNSNGFIGVIEAAELLGISKAHLNRIRGKGEGPPEYHLGARVVFQERELIDWVKSRSTALQAQAEPNAQPAPKNLAFKSSTI